MRVATPGVLVVVFGATGRVGTAVVDALESRPGIAVARIARTNSASERPPDVVLDVTDAVGRTGRVEAVCELAAGHRRVVLLDAVLDRSSVTAMRTSLRGATDLVIHASETLRQRGHTVGIVVASTTAVLAPRPYQTPYGLAKRAQLRRYANSGLPGCAALLPMLRAANQLPALGAPRDDRWLAPLTGLPRIVWEYRRAADLLASACTEMQDAFYLVACDGAPSTDLPRLFAVTQRALAVLAVVPLMLAGWTVGRRSPHLRRLASYGRLFVTPPSIRRCIDHHLTPPGRVAALARRLDAPVTWTTP
jgi:hypothetical protein